MKSGEIQIFDDPAQLAGAREAYLRKAPKDQTIAELTARVFRNPRLKPKPKEIDGGSENKPE